MNSLLPRAGPFLWMFLLLSLLSFNQSVEGSSMPSPSNSTRPSISIKITGLPVSVWSAAETMNQCNNGQIDVPDIPARAFLASKNNSENEIVRIVVGAEGYHEMHGPSIFNQTRSCDFSWNATFDPDPSMFSANEFLDSTFRFDNGTVLALVHTEFPGNKYNACDTFQDFSHEIRTEETGRDTNRQLRRRFALRANPAPLTYPTCWTVSIGMVVSHDFGMTWNHIAEPPNHLVAAVPYTYNQSHLAYGWGDPSNIVQSPFDGFYYVAMYNRNRIGDQKAGVCIARTNDLLDPTSWRGWNGQDFFVEFANPYTQPNLDPQEHSCQTIDFLGIPEGCTVLSMVYSEYLLEFVATIGCLVGKEFGKHFYYSTSIDFIYWSQVTEFYNRDIDLPPEVRSKTTSIQYPSLLDPMYGGPNFDKIGQKPYLFWTSIGHSPHTDGRHLWATPIQFDVNVDTRKDIS